MRNELSASAYIEGLVERARIAQGVAESHDQKRVDELCEAVAFAATNENFRRKAAEMLVEESKIGLVDSKFNKIRLKALGVYRDMKGVQSTGIIESDSIKNTVTIIKPIGVIGAVLPVTNGEATPVVKALWALKSRNAIIMSPARAGAKTGQYVCSYIRRVLKSMGAPEDLVICIEPEMAGRETCMEMMDQCDFVIATGGAGLVKSAYSSGTPAIGVGVGNVTTYIDPSADIGQAAKKIGRSKTFDNSSSCSSENNALVHEAVYNEFVSALEGEGAYIIRNGSEEKKALIRTIWPEWPEKRAINRLIAGRSAETILDLAGIKPESEVKFICVEEFDGIGDAYPLTGEKLSPVTTLIKVKSFDAALEKLNDCLNYMGRGHSCGIHTTDKAQALKLAEQMKVARILVNQPQSLGNAGGFFNGLPMSMSLGCGTWGNNSTCSAITWKDCVNTTTLSWPLDEAVPYEDELFSEKIRSMTFEH